MQDKFAQGTFMSDDLISCRALYKANGFSDDDFSRPVIGICNSFTDIVPGHKNLKEVTEQVKFGVYRAGGTPVEFGCIAVCDSVRYAGPKGAPGMPEMFKPMKLLYGQGLAKCTALITDGRFSGTNNGCFVGHISPEAASGGPIALIEDGDKILVDVVHRKLELKVSEEELAARKARFHYEAPKVEGYLKRYQRDAQSADKGGILL